MAQVSPSLEDENKTSQDSGVFSSILDTAENIWSKALDIWKDVWSYVVDTWKELLWTWANMIEDTAKASVNLFKEVKNQWFDIFSNVWELYETSKKQKYNDFELKQSEELNKLWTMDMTKWVFSLWKNILSEVTFGNVVSNNLKVDKKDFDTQVWLYTTQINQLNSELDNIDKNKYKDYLSFEDRVKQSYLKMKWSSDIQDQNDFQLFRQQELKRLNAFDQNNIISQEQQYSQDTNDIQNNIMKQQEELKNYLNNSISTDWDKTWEQLYNEYNEEQQKKLKENKYVNTISEIYNYSKQQVEDWLESKWLAKVSDWTWYDSMKDAIVDDIAAENQYFMTVLGMKNLPDYEVFADKAKEIRDVSFKFKMEFADNLVKHKNDEQFKWMSDIDIKNAIQKMTWDNFSLADKQTYKQKEKLITEVSAIKNYTEMKERWKNLDPRALIDLVSWVTSTIQTVIDKAYDIDTDEVPHFIKWDMRNIIYAWEWIGKNIISSITYNPDALVSLVVWTKWLDKIGKAVQWISSVTKSLSWIDKVMPVTVNVWGKSGTLRLASKTIKNLTSSQLYWTVWDTVFDNVMVQAPDKATEWFNMISNVLFDTTPFVYSEAKKSSTLNYLSYKFFKNPEDKEVIKQFADVHKIDIWSAKSILDDGVNKMYKNLFNPKEYNEIFSKPWNLYNFVSENINRMEKSKVDWILTEKWIPLSLERELDWLTDKNRYDITDAFEKSLNKTVEWQFSKARLNDLVWLYKDFITPWKWGWLDIQDIKIKKEAINNEEFNKLHTLWLKALEDIKLASTKEEFNTALQNYNNSLQEIRRKFSNKKFQNYIRVMNPHDDSKDILINIDELDTWADKSFTDIIRDWKVKIIKKDSWFEWKELQIRTNERILSDNVMNDFLFKNKERIQNFISETWIDLKNQTIESTIKSLFYWDTNSLIRNFFTQDQLKNNDKVVEETMLFINTLLWELLNKWWIYVKKDPININKSIKDLNKETYLVKAEQIKELAQKQESYVNLSYWYFIDKKWDYKFAMYLLPWKKILDDDIMNEAFNWMKESVNNEWKKVLTANNNVLINQWKKIIRSVFELWINKDWFDFIRWLSKTKWVYSFWNTEWIFIDWKIIKNKLDSIVKDIYWDNDWLNDIQWFVYWIVKDIQSSDSALIKPIIYNITQNYASNKDLIDYIINNKWVQFEQLFSDLLISPTMVDKIISKIKDSWGKIPNEYKDINDSILIKANNEWERYQKVLNDRLFLLNDQKKELESYLDNKLSDEIYLNIQNEISKIDNKISAINKDLKFWKKYTDKEVNNMFTDMYRELIKKKVDNIWWEILWTYKNIFTWEEIKTLSDKINTQKELLNKVINWSDKFKKEIWEFLDIVKNDDKLYSNTLKHLNETDNEDLKKVFNKVLELYKNMWEDIKLVNNDIELENYLTSFNRNILNHEWALENNPIKKKLNAFINNSPTWQDDELNKKIISYFHKDNEEYITYYRWQTKWYKFSSDVWDWWKWIYLASDYHQAVSYLPKIWWAIYEFKIPKNIKLKEIDVFWNATDKIIIPEWFDWIKELSTWNIVLRDNYKHNKPKEYTEEEFNDYVYNSYINNWNLNNLWKDILNISNIDELYEKSDSFKKFIWELNLENWELPKKVVHNFRNKLKDILSWEIVVTNKSDNISDELINDLIRDRKLFARFKNLKNRQKLIEWEWNSAVNIKVSKWYWWRNILTFEKEKYVDKVIQFENMKSIWIDFKLLNWLNSKTIKYFTIDDWDKKKTLSNVIRKYFDNLKIKYSDNEEWYLKAISASPITELKLFSDIFNRNKDSELYNLLNDTEKKSLINNSRLSKYDSEYVFVWWFGDKDSNMHLYKMPNDIISKVNKDDLKKTSLLIYNAEYAYANWYLLFNRELKTFNDFKNELIKDLRDWFTYKDIEEKFLELSNKNLIDLDVIRKREASNTSNFNTFWNHKEPVNLYIIDEVIDKNNDLYKFKFNWNKIDDFLDWLNEDNKNNFIDFINEYIKEDTIISNRIKQLLEKDWSYDKVLTYIKNTYDNDLQDWTSFISDYLIKLRWYLNWLTEKEVDSLEYKQFKDHFFWENEKTNWVRIFGKTLFNSSEIKEWWNLIDNAVAIGKSSLKLWKDIYKNSKETIITIDWKEYKARFIEWTDTSFFKNAATDLFEHEEEQTFSDSIKASLSSIASKKITELQKKQITEAFNSTLASLWDFTININSYSSLDKYINDVVSIYQKWFSTSSVLWNKLNEFLSTADQIINKPQDKWQSMFIRESSLKVKPNEVIMHKDSQIVKQIFSEVKEKMFPWIERLTKEQQDEVYNNLFTIGYRYPVPSKYNMWVYKIRFSDEFDEYKNMWTNQVVPHPETTYMKLEWDNDGDHIFFISTNTNFGKIVTEDILNNSKIDLWSNVYESLKWMYDDWKLNNDFIVIEQVEKIWWDKDKLKKEYKDILRSRLSSIEAKTYIWNVSATIRTIKLLSKQDFNSNEKVVRTIEWDKDNFIFESTTFKNLFNEYKKYNKWNDINFNVSERDFAANAAQLLQATLDFGNSWLDKFDNEWFMKLLDNALPWVDNMAKYKIQNEVISALSMWYKNNEFKSSTISSVSSALSMQWKLSDKQNNILNKNLFWIIWDKRELLNYLYSWKIVNENNKTIWIWDLISKLNKTQDLSWIINKVLPNSKNDTIKKILKDITSDTWYNKYGYINEKKSKELSKIIYSDKNYISNMGIFKEFNNYLFEKDKKKRELLWKDLFPKILKLEKDDRYWLALYWLLNKEYKVLNFAIWNEIKDFLEYSDQNFLDRLNKEIEDWFINIPKTFTKQQRDNYLNELKDWLEDWINTLKQFDNWDSLELQNNISNLELRLWKVESILNELDNIKESEKNIIQQVRDIKEEITYQEYHFPWLEERTIDISKDWINELLSENEWFINKSVNYVSWFVATFFWRYAPKFLSDYNNINDLLWSKNQLMKDAVLKHSYDFNEYFDNKNSIIRQIKNTWIEKYQDISRKLQYELLDYKDGVFILRNREDIITNIKRHLNSTKAEYLLNDNKFIDSLVNYQSVVIKNVVEMLNKIESMWFKINDNYRKEQYSLVLDVLEAHKADAQLALRLNWFLNRDTFTTFISNQTDKEWKKAFKWTITTMADVLYWTQWAWYDKILWFLQWLHYKMNYWEMSIVTWNGIMSWLAQTFPNYVELRSYMRKNLTDIKEWFTVMQRLWLLDSESVLDYGTWLGKDFNDSSFLDWTITKIMRKFWDRDIKWNQATSLLYSILTNPLGWFDFPIENMRKLVAISNTMKVLWVKNANDLDRKILVYGKDFEWLFRSEVRKQFAESWGWVNSSSKIYRDTVFNHLHNYVDIFWVRFLTKSMWYLMWWSYHKWTKLLEKESALYYWIKDLAKWNYSWFKDHLDDWFTYNSILFHQVWMAAWIYMKMEKYEKDTNDWVSFDSFNKSFSNSIVSMNILFEKHIKNWETAWEYSWSLEDKIAYTTLWFVRNVFRLFWQPAFVATMYKHYSYSQSEWKANVFNSLQYAMSQHYSAFVRFNWIEEMNNSYDTLSNEWKVAMLWTWADTEMEELLSRVDNAKFFAYYKDKWFIKTIYDLFIWWGILWFKDQENLPSSLQTYISKDLQSMIMNDKQLSQLIRWGQFWEWQWEFNISRIYWIKWSILNEDQEQAVNDMYKHLNDYNYDYLRSTWVKVDSYTQSVNDRILQDQIDNALKKEKINIEDLISKTWYSADLLKTLSVLETKYWLKNPLVISTLINNELNSELKKLKEEKWRLTWEVSEYWTKYTSVSEEDKLMLKRDILLKYQSYFNLNREIWMEIISQDIKMKYWDKLEDIRKNYDKYWNAEKDMLQYIKSSYLIWQVAKEWDTSVSKLHSRYALAAKWLPDNETSVRIANDFLFKMFNDSSLWMKEKLANGAAFISWLDKATYWLLSNNETFNKLTDSSKRLLMNWVFKINKEAIDYDSSSYLNDLNQSVNKPKEWSWYRMTYPKYKSKSFSWDRPWFSKQFTPTQKLVWQYPQYISKDPNWFIKKFNTPVQWNDVYNNLRSPIMRQYKDLIIESTFYGYKSKWIIKQFIQPKEVDKQAKKNINLKKAKSMKEPVKKATKTYKAYQRLNTINME